jgi:catechol 2,3-dioxygenase-like lactoylglutathione lyase family enzyme
MLNAPAIDAIDHLHLHVSDRPAAEAWYARVLGLQRVAVLAHWALDGGPLTLADADDRLHLALFQSPSQGGKPTVALRVSALGLQAWRLHLQRELGQLPTVVDHGESRSLYFTDPDGNGFEITSYERSHESSALMQLLSDELAHAPEYLDSQRASSGPLPADGGAYSSHLPMALHALAALGADEARLHAWAAKAFPTVPALGSDPDLAREEQSIAEALDREGEGGALARLLPALMPGCGGMAFHLLIRTGHAWESGHRGQLVRSLAYWRLRSAPLPSTSEPEGERLQFADWWQALLALPAPDGMHQPWISARMLHAAAQPGFQAVAPRLALTPDLLDRLAHQLATVYAGSGNFTLLHGLTATRAMRLLLPLVPHSARSACLRDFTRQIGAALIASRWRGALEAAPEPRDWDRLRAQAVAHDDEHTIKLVHAAWQLGAESTDPVWQQAAARALQAFATQG